MQYVPVAFVDEGMTVWTSFAPFCPPELRATFRGERMVRCTVQTAAGYHARIFNGDVGIDQWVHIDVLRRAVSEPAQSAPACGDGEAICSSCGRGYRGCCLCQMEPDG